MLIFSAANDGSAAVVDRQELEVVVQLQSKVGDGSRKCNDRDGNLPFEYQQSNATVVIRSGFGGSYRNER